MEARNDITRVSAARGQAKGCADGCAEPLAKELGARPGSALHNRNYEVTPMNHAILA